jgi:WD40 repeat protein
MTAIHPEVYEYKVGGSLPPGAPSYVTRRADQELVAALAVGEFCYVFNSRQMGKSSLKAQTMRSLETRNIACAAVDVTKLGARQVTADQWYKGLVVELVRVFHLNSTFDLKTWRHQHRELSAIQQLSLFIEDVLLTHLPQAQICIFLEEIDNVKSLEFSTDDLFALIRSCYEQRITEPMYDRLTFCLLGVATPSDLITDKQRTPFNVGRSIDLTGFTFAEAQTPLTQGLIGKVTQPAAVLQAILDWTGGQPFLTQKVCRLVAEAMTHAPAGFSVLSPSELVKQVVQTQVIEQWESQDVPPHLRTIRDRLRGSGQRRGRLLGLYQQILQGQAIPIDDSPEQMELQLSGLVVKQEGKLQVYNLIYAAVFNLTWVEQELTALRPEFYAVPLSGWLNSQGEDTAWLLRGQVLQQAQQWATEQRLSDQDYRFLEASQALEQRDLKQRFEAEAEAAGILAEANFVLLDANQVLEQSNRKAKRQMQIGGVILSLSLVVAIGAGFLARRMLQAAQLEQIKSFSLASTAALNANQELDALVAALKAATQLQASSWTDADTRSTVQLALQRSLFQISERDRLEGHTDQVRSVSFSPNGKILATASEDHTVRLWSIDGHELQQLSAQNQALRSVRFSPDGQRLAAISSNNTVKLWSVSSRELLTLPGQVGEDNFMSDLCFSSNAQVIVAAGANNTVKLWSIDGQALKTLSGHQHPVWSLSCSPDGQIIVTADRGGTVKLWRMDGQELKSFRASPQSIFGVSFSPDGQSIVTAGGDKQVNLWNLEGQVIRTIGKHDNAVMGAQFSPDGQMIASVSADKTTKLWSLAGRNLKTFKGHHNGIFDLSFSPDGQSLATAGGDHTVRLWSLSNQTHQTLIGHTDSLWSVSISPDGSLIATAGDDQTIRLWNRQGRSLTTIRAKSGEWSRIWSLSFSPDGKAIVAASSDHTLKLWSLNGHLLGTLNGHSDQVTDVSFSSNGQRLASASFDGTIRLWQINGQPLKTLTANAGKVRSVSFSPDGSFFASAHDDGTINLWNLQGQRLKAIQADNRYSNQVRFSPDGKLLAAAGRDRTIKLWTIDGQPVRTLRGATAEVMGLSFSPDGRRLASASADGSIRLWAVETGQELHTIQGRGYPFWNVSFSPNGKTLVSVSDDAQVEIWNAENLDFEPLLTRGCDWIRDYLQHNVRVDASDRRLCNNIPALKSGG